MDTEYRLKSDFELHPVEGESFFWLGISGRHFHVDPEFARCLEALKERRLGSMTLSGPELTAHIAQAERQTLLDQLLQVGVVEPAGDNHGVSPKAQRRSYIKAQLNLAGENAVLRLASPFNVLFNRFAASFLVLFIIAAHAAFFASAGEFWLGGRRIIEAIHVFGATDFLLTFAVFVACIFFHEMGHAAAAIRHGVSPKRIGFGIYFIFPVMFADVSETWRLSARQRMTVNIGGIYFQLLLNAILILILTALGVNSALHEALRYLVLLNIISVIHSMNPILRFDGYWLFSDAFRLPNLRAAAWSQLATLVRQPAAFFADIRQFLLSVYGILCGGFLFLYAYWMNNLFQYARQVVRDNPDALVSAFSISSPEELLVLLFRLLYIALLCGVIFIFLRTIFRYFGFAIRYLRRKFVPAQTAASGAKAVSEENSGARQ